MQPSTQPPYFTALARGLRNRCPECNKGRLFDRYLKVADTCSVCGEELHHHRADDMPAYLTILILGHILVPGVVWLEVEHSPAYWVQAAIWLPVTILLCLMLLPLTKGAVVATEWYLGLRGFYPSKQRRLGIAPDSSEAP